MGVILSEAVFSGEEKDLVRRPAASSVAPARSLPRLNCAEIVVTPLNARSNDPNCTST